MMMQEYTQTTGDECPRALTELILYLYGEIEDKGEFEEHLAGCEFCKRALAEYRNALEIYRSDEVHTPLLELKTQSSFWNKLQQFVGTWKITPAYWGALVMGILIITFLTVHWADKNLKSTQNTGNASYSWISTELDELDYELDNLLSFNISAYSSEIQNEDEIVAAETADDITDVLLDELDELQTNMKSF